MSKQDAYHEDFGHGEAVRAGSPRAFGIVFAVVFALIGGWPLIDGLGVRAWALWISGGFLAAALIRPAILAPLNLLWFKFGMLLHKIVNPIVMGLLFFVTVTPIALIMRLAGKDPLRQKFDQAAPTYWIDRAPNELTAESMKNQF